MTSLALMNQSNARLQLLKDYTEPLCSLVQAYKNLITIHPEIRHLFADVVEPTFRKDNSQETPMNQLILWLFAVLGRPAYRFILSLYFIRLPNVDKIFEFLITWTDKIEKYYEDYVEAITPERLDLNGIDESLTSNMFSQYLAGRTVLQKEAQVVALPADIAAEASVGQLKLNYMIFIIESLTSFKGKFRSKIEQDINGPINIGETIKANNLSTVNDPNKIILILHTAKIPITVNDIIDEIKFLQ